MSDSFLLSMSACRGRGHPRRGPLMTWASPTYPRILHSPRHGPWARYGVGRGCQIFGPHNSPSKFCCPASRAGRGILMFSGLCPDLSSFVFLLVSQSFQLPRGRSWRFGIWSVPSLNFGGSVSSTFNGVMMNGRWGCSWLIGRESPCGYF